MVMMKLLYEGRELKTAVRVAKGAGTGTGVHDNDGHRYTTTKDTNLAPTD